MYTAILKIEDGRIAKYAEFEVAADAADHVTNFSENYPDGFVYSGAYSPSLFVDGNFVSERPRFEAETQAAYVAAIQKRLDDFARTRNYDGILSAATYATSTATTFKAEGQYAVEARDMTWAKAYEILAEVISGNRAAPTLNELLAELPPLEWP